jgi:hypothetical protein
MVRRLQEAPFTGQINHSEQLLRLSMRAEGTSETPDETAAEYQWAISRRPDDRFLHFNYGLFLYNYNPMAAEAEFRAARPFDGFPLVTPDGRMH